jgi:hypothetical protein
MSLNIPVFFLLSALIALIRRRPHLHRTRHRWVFPPSTQQAGGIAPSQLCVCWIYISLGVRITIDILQGVKIGASLAGVAFLIITIVSIVYFRRRQRLRLQQARGLAIDSDGPLIETRTKDVPGPGSLTPFMLPLPINILSDLQTPLKKPPPTAFPPPTRQPRTRQNELDPGQPSRRDVGLRPDPAGNVGDTLVEMMQSMQHIQERLLHLEGHLSGERAQDREQDQQRLRRISTAQSGENPFETRSEGTLGAPPTYKE